MRRLLVALAFLAAASAAGLKPIELPPPPQPTVEKAEPSSPIVEIPVEPVKIVETAAESTAAVIASPDGSNPLALPEVAPTPVKIVEAPAAEVAPTPVKIVEAPAAEVAPTPVKIIEAPAVEVVPTPVKIVEVPAAEVAPTPVQIVETVAEVQPTAEVSPIPVQIVETVAEVQPTPVQIVEAVAEVQPTAEVAPTPVQIIDVAFNTPEAQSVKAAPAVEAVKLVDSPEFASPAAEVAPTPVVVVKTPVFPSTLAAAPLEVQPVKVVDSPVETVAPEPVKIVEFAENAPTRETVRVVELNPMHFGPIPDAFVMPRHQIGNNGDRVITVDLSNPASLIDISPMIIPPEVMKQIAEMAAHDTEAIYIGDAHPFAYNAEPLEVEPVKIVDSPINELTDQMDPVVIMDTAVNEESAPFSFAGHDFRPIPREYLRSVNIGTRRRELPPHLAPHFAAPHGVQPEFLRGGAFQDFEYRDVHGYPEDFRAPIPYHVPPHLVGEPNPMLR